MSTTYSISVGTSIESYRKSDIYSAIQDLPDNTQKMIGPKDVRDAFLTTWAASAFKQTIGTASIEYIGIDSSNPSDRDIKKKIFIGKRSYTGSDIMSMPLLQVSSSDVYFFNTKSDSSDQSQTKISILAGTNSSLYITAPYILSERITGGSGETIKLDIVNPSTSEGPINIYSQTGRVDINGIMFPTIAETSASASNGRILRYSGTYPTGSLKWDDATVTVASIGSAGAITNIYGSPSNVNGYSLEFIDSNIVPQTIGGVNIGDSFATYSYDGYLGYQNWPLSEVIRKLLYPYVPPTLSLSIDTTYAEIGVTTSVNIDYSITRYSYDIVDYQIGSATYGLSFSASPGGITSSIFSYNAYTSSVSTIDYVLEVSDSVVSGFSHSATASIQFVSPIFYSFGSTYIDLPGGSASQLGTLMNSSSKYIGSSQSVSLSYSGSGYLYFLSPALYSNLSLIRDPNGYIIHDSSNLSLSSFTYSGVITPTGVSGSVNYGDYIIYRTIATCSYTGGGTFGFTF